VYLEEAMTVGDIFWCDFRKVYIGVLYVVESRDRNRDKDREYVVEIETRGSDR
jgi:hypothetical protein